MIVFSVPQHASHFYLSYLNDLMGKKNAHAYSKSTTCSICRTTLHTVHTSHNMRLIKPPASAALPAESATCADTPPGVLPSSCLRVRQHDPPLEISDLIDDLKDSTKLLALLSVLSGQELVRTARWRWWVTSRRSRVEGCLVMVTC